MSNYDAWKTRSDLDDWAARNHELPESGDEFSVCQFFVDGGYEWVRRYVGSEEAVKAARHYTGNVASQLGVIERVVITDADDYCVFEWKKGEGVTFPPEARGRQ
jgi:hypothetical protein